MKIAYWLITGLFCLLMLGSAGMYPFNHAEIAAIFEKLDYPTYVIHPLAITKFSA